MELRELLILSLLGESKDDGSGNMWARTAKLDRAAHSESRECFTLQPNTPTQIFHGPENLPPGSYWGAGEKRCMPDSTFNLGKKGFMCSKHMDHFKQPRRYRGNLHYLSWAKENSLKAHLWVTLRTETRYRKTSVYQRAEVPTIAFWGRSLWNKPPNHHK